MTIPTTDLLRLTQWMSPAFPTSGYAYSHGFEAAHARGIATADDVRDWLRAVLQYGSGPLDCWAVRAVLAGASPDAVAATLRARAGCAERWRETWDQGAAFAATTNALGLPHLRPAPLPVVLAVRARGILPTTVCALYLQALAGQVVSAALRLVPLGQTQGQGIIAALHSDIAEVAAAEWDEPPGLGAVLAECDATAHEVQQPRLFRT
ncbi:urease accessory protein UreF [Jannaschia sp. LMIT008]|uniref:urease accessory protein UreF n=1 Tax=Jannaschia maritima TaxID=3032585 RepID=UPI0028111F20|nr:urease accessory UreF family protein [Jannaschia sp. LMIT008]